MKDTVTLEYSKVQELLTAARLAVELLNNHPARIYFSQVTDRLDVAVKEVGRALPVRRGKS